ncbi:MAG: lysylphosphatidylglycerol synthase transmembrane domain-containing protein [Candidatus Paceibacterota bacterium]
MKQKLKQNLIFLAKFAASILLINFLLTKIDYQSVLAVLGELKWGYFAVAVLISFVALFINAYKWRILLTPIISTVSVIKLFELNLIGLFYGNFLPGGQLTGEVVKTYRVLPLLSEKYKIVFSVFFDRVTGFIALSILGAVVFLVAGPNLARPNAIEWSFAILFLISVVSVLLFNKKFFSLMVKVGSLLIPAQGWPDRIFKNLVSGFNLYLGDYRLIGKSIMVGVVFQFVNFLSLYFVSLALNLPIGLTNIIWVYALVSVILFIPISIMGLGQREISFVYLLGLIGVSETHAVSLSLGVFVSILAGALVGGLLELAYFLRNRQRGSQDKSVV